MGGRAFARPEGPIAAGKTLKASASVSPWFRFVEGPWGLANQMKQLPPGRYQVRIDISFPNELNGKPAGAIWPARAITTEPVEVEIAAEK
jgi:hypothetical protein